MELGEAQTSPQEGLAVIRVEGSAPRKLVRRFLNPIEIEEDETTFPRVSSQVRGKAQGMIELFQALVKASSRVNAAADALALHKEGGPFAQQAAGLVDPLFFRRVKLKPTAAAHAAAGGGGASLLSSWLLFFL